MSSNDTKSKSEETTSEIKESQDTEKDQSGTTKIEDVGPEETEPQEATECVTMLDVLQDENDLEEDARAVLGSADDRNCTYSDAQSNGYLKRQALYACLTCSVPNDPNFCPAGICLACSYACHNDHTLVELYTKRNFRCDCGNSKFPKSNPCKLYANKAHENERNQYNQNYRGVYCTCHRPYPDEEDTVPDAMIQCAMCEDWFHRRHLQVEDEKIPPQVAFEEMICYQCCERYHESFLFGYRDLSVEGDVILNSVGKPIIERKESTDSIASLSTSEDANSSIKENIRPLFPQPEISLHNHEKERTKTDNKCFLEEIAVEKKNAPPSTLFMQQGWREQLCRCNKCTQKYQNLSLDYLLDEEDTLDYYENEGSDYSEDDSLMKAMSSMDRTQQIETVHGYNMLKNNLAEYLKKFAENKTVVREEDIQEFFQELSAKKKMKMNPPDNCK